MIIIKKNEKAKKKKNVFKKFIKSITSKMFKTLLSSNRKNIYCEFINHLL